MKSIDSSRLAKRGRNSGGSRLIGVSVVLSALTILVSSSVVADYSRTRDLTVEQRPVVELRPDSPALNVTASLSQLDGEFHFGDKLSIEVATSRDAYVTVLNVGTSGKVHIVFPNEFQKDNLVKAGENVVIPGADASFDLKIGPPAGVEVIKVIATLEPDRIISPEDVNLKGPVAETKQEAPALVRDISVALRDDHDKGWAEETILISIKP
jgi:hypothetical protein